MASFKYKDVYLNRFYSIAGLYENNGNLKNVNRYDLNSMYPSIMAYRDLPYGKPIVGFKPGRFRFELYQVAISFKLKDGHLPTLLKTGSLFNKTGDTYYTESVGVIDIYISSIDLELMYRHYDIYYIKYLKIWGFKTIRGIFSDWVKVMYENKSKGPDGKESKSPLEHK